MFPEPLFAHTAEMTAARAAPRPSREREDAQATERHGHRHQPHDGSSLDESLGFGDARVCSLVHISDRPAARIIEPPLCNTAQTSRRVAPYT